MLLTEHFMLDWSKTNALKVKKKKITQEIIPHRRFTIVWNFGLCTKRTVKHEIVAALFKRTAFGAITKNIYTYYLQLFSKIKKNMRTRKIYYSPTTL